MKYLILIWLVGCYVTACELAYMLNQKSEKKLGFMYAMFYILSKKVNYKYILMSWYFLIKKDT